MPHPARSFAAAVTCLLAAALVGATVSPAIAQTTTHPGTPVDYSLPADAPVVDGFRPPPQPWSAGNRGVDLGTPAGAAVHAAADGEVVFAGVVAGSRHVVVLHADGIRTSYSFLAGIEVRRGQRVAADDVVGVAGGPLHFGARAGDVYIDPLSLLRDPAPAVHLVPDDDRRPDTEAGERSKLSRFLRFARTELGAGAQAAVAWARDTPARVLAPLHNGPALLEEARAWISYARRLDPFGVPLQMVDSVREWMATRGHCTPADTPQPRLTSRHLAVLVAGLGSASGDAAVLHVDTAALGYGGDDVVQFSYRGGTTAEHPYRPADTQGDLWESGRRLGDLLDRLAADHPGVPIDVIAHSQGGLVARAALFGRTRSLPSTVVTLATPHHGADLATAAMVFGRTSPGGQLEWLASRVKPLDIDVRSKAVRQLAETSSFIDDLGAVPSPPGVHTVSVAARTDWVVPSVRSHLDGAANVVVDGPGVADAHLDLPGTAVAQREIALAVTGASPTCESLANALVDRMTSSLIERAEAAAGAGLGGATNLLGPSPSSWPR